MLSIDLGSMSPMLSPAKRLPSSLFAFIFQTSGFHQILLSILSMGVFLLNTAPLEIQRRVVNDAFRGGQYRQIFLLALAYAAVALSAGLIKLTMNIYRSWITARSIKSLRNIIFALVGVGSEEVGRREGVEVSMVLEEAEPIGGFVGVSVSEPILQLGMLASVFGYMAFLEPVMALASLVVFAPQVIFVLLMQRAINRRLNERVRTLRDVSSEIIGNYQNPQNVIDAQAERVEQVFTLDMGIFKLTFAMKFLLNLFHHFGVACVLGLGGWYVVNGQTEIGTVVAFLSGIAAINDPWIDAVAWYRDLAMTRTRYKLLVTGVEQIGSA